MLYKLIAKIVSQPKVFNYLLKRAIKTPYKHIYDKDGIEIYMERYWLFNPYFPTEGLKQHKWCPVSIRVHRINSHDHDRHMHDHPWNARTFIMKGWYQETRQQMGTLDCLTQAHRTAGDTVRLNFGEYHRITRVSNGGVYTIFVTGKYRGVWSFLVNGVEQKYYDYLGLKKPKKSRS